MGGPEQREWGAVKSVLVTGGAGFVGSRLAMGIKEARPEVRVTALDNLRRRGSELNLPRLRAAGVDFVHGDIRNGDDIDAAGPADVILECSAEPSVLAGYGGSPRYVIDTNLAGTVNCLEAARNWGAGVVFLSTSRVYPVKALEGLAWREEATRFELDSDQPVPGATTQGISESFPLEGARSLYGVTKLCSELLLQEFGELYGVRSVVNRCGVIAGPWQMGRTDQGVAALWVARHVYGGSLNYIGYGGTGKQVRDLLHVDDLLRLVMYELDHLDALNGETFNVGGGRKSSASLQELTTLCRAATGRSLDIGSVTEDRPADIRIYITDHARVTARTGWEPRHDVRRIVEDIYRWIRDNEEALKPILA